MPRTRKSPTKPTGPVTYLLHVSLEGIEPPVWRRLWVDGGFTLNALHHILQAAMGWTDAHLHDFRIDGKRYALPDPEWDDLRRETQVDERTVRL
ncbi:plasmid pRiA4b ORF-3 family protein, partial [Acidithiobacillus sp.]|uniref:plasmid pRiA4b ORF-3 family protein n=1 Tax=Acidithiobacillus sp. TaxID=1872118 RepID=UPI003D044C3A